jgi:hypothetical protein
MFTVVVCALASIEAERGRDDAAVSLQRDALRYSYLSPYVNGIADSYHVLGLYLRDGRQLIPALACHLIAALIRTIAGADDVNRMVRSAADELIGLGTNAEIPTDVADLCRKIGAIPGTHPAALIAGLSPDWETAERTLQELVAKARELAGTLPKDAPPSE